MVKNEFKFLRELCRSISPIDRRIRFVGIVNHDGKLLTGLKEATIPMSDTRSRGTHESFFVLSSLIEGIKDINSCSAENRTLQISITEFNSTMLIVIPLNCQSDRYLCIYLESRSFNEEFLSIILDGIDP
jgi:hypothetical protein